MKCIDIVRFFFSFCLYYLKKPTTVKQLDLIEEESMEKVIPSNSFSGVFCIIFMIKSLQFCSSISGCDMYRSKYVYVCIYIELSVG